MIDAAHHVAVHVDQPAIGVVGKALVAGGIGQADDRLVVQAEVENRVHHARHRDGGAAADRDEQRILRVAEFLAQLFFERGDVGGHVVHQAGGQLAAALVVQVADLGRDRETGRHRQPDAGHLGQVGPLAAEQLLLLAAAFGLRAAEVVDHLFRLAVRGSAARRVGGRTCFRFALDADSCHVLTKGVDDRMDRGSKTRKIA